MTLKIRSAGYYIVLRRYLRCITEYIISDGGSDGDHRTFLHEIAVLDDESSV